MSASNILSANIKLYFFSESVGNFMAGKRGVSLNCSRDMVDVTAQITPSAALQKAYKPGLLEASMEFDGLYIIPDTQTSDLNIPRSAANLMQTLREKTQCKALINIYPGTAGASYLDSETISCFGYVSNVKVSASNLGDATTFSCTFHVTTEPQIVNGEGDPIYTP